MTPPPADAHLSRGEQEINAHDHFHPILAALTFGVFFAGSGAVYAGIIIGNG